jgi:hypothetical protein
MTRSVFRAVGLATAIAAATVSFAATAYAGPFDGSWSVLIVTRSGGCDPSYRFGVTISNGVVYGGGGASLSGRVSNNGAVSVAVSSSQGSARGSGRLSRNSGGGSWRGSGPTGACAGVWSASRG